MKRCPQCNSVYGDENLYCLNDGTVLIEETFVLPSDADDFEAETIIRNEPMTVDLSSQNIPPEPIIYQMPPNETVVIKQPANRRNSAIFLVLGLLLGGGLVLATLILARSFYQTGDTTTVKVNQSTNPNSNKARTNSPAETPLDTDKLTQKHETRTSTDDEEFNGRVIAVNAYVRASPNRSSDETDVLPIDDRLNIERRETEKSPWYYVTCEHGASGWMHGNTIEFTP